MKPTNSDMRKMGIVLRLTRLFAKNVPVGAALVGRNGRIILFRTNGRGTYGHAEAKLIRFLDLTRIGRQLLRTGSLFVTLEPCPMCAAMIRKSGATRIVFGAFSELGAAGSQLDLIRDPRLGAGPEVVGGVISEECGAILRDYFQGKRNSRSTSPIVIPFSR